jgi:HK97 family phage prohead protease
MRDISERANGTVYRSYDLADFEFRDGGETGFTFEGVASVVDKPYVVRDIFGEFTETIAAGAFNRTLNNKQADVLLFVNHRHSDVPMASRRAGTLKLSADPNLRAVADLDPVRPDVIIARSAVMRGEMRQMSIGFSVPKDKNKDMWSPDYSERTIKELNLVEVSIVPQGANPHTEASMRSLDDLLESITDIDMTEDEIRRAIAAFEARLPHSDEPGELINPYAERDRLDAERLERRKHAQLISA